MKKLTHTKELSTNRLRAVSKLLRGTIKLSLLLGLMGISLQIANAATFTVSNGGDSGGGTLRQAILDANATAEADIITFSGALTITPTTPLPAIINPVTIDGYTSVPGATQNTATTGNGFNGTLVVELEGSMAGDSAIGLQISSGNCLIRGLVINRFRGAGIRIDGGTGTRIFGNFIGTDINGMAALGNFDRGVLIVGSRVNQIGAGAESGLAPNVISAESTTNVISGNFGTGISITGGGSAVVRRNFIGTDKSGTADLGNTQDGVRIVDSPGSTIGGANLASRNVISGNDANGVAVVQSVNPTSAASTANSNVISANFIGVDVTGNTSTAVGGFPTSAVGNSGSGVLVNAAGNTVGGNRTTSASSSECNNRCNVISGNRANGVSVSSSFASANIVTGNNIGVGLNNTSVIGNRDNGVQISNLALGNTIGGTTTTPGACNNVCNMIANNGAADANSARAGVYVDITGGAGNSIRGNSIFMNTGIGIDISNVGATGNDSLDPDTGANNRQNFPILNSANNDGNISGTLNSTPNTNFVIDFFRNASPDTMSTSEGRTFVGSAPVITDGSGNAVISSSLGAMTITTGQFITATATSTGGMAQTVGDTSEISEARLVLAAAGMGAQGIEADVDPRMNGNGTVQSGDVVQMRRFVNRTDTPDPATNEFQRADSSPYNPNTNTYGDGVINAEDIVQTRRFANRTDPQTPAAGPTGPQMQNTSNNTVLLADSEKAKMRVNAPTAHQRQLRVQSTNGSAGNPAIVNIRVDSLGDEAEYSFTVNYDQAVLTNPVVSNGNTGAGAVACNTTSQPGRIFCSVGTFPTNRTGDPNVGEIAPADNQILISIRFTISRNAQPSTTNVTLTDVAASDDTPPLALAITSVDGTVTVNGTTASGASISGRVTAGRRGVARAIVTLTDENGVTRRTMTSALGTYRFTGIPVAQTYTLNAQAKRYRFATQIVNLSQDTSGFNFTAAP